MNAAGQAEEVGEIPHSVMEELCLGLKLPIYLDHHATTPVDSRVLDRMLPFFTEVYGNAASRSHAFGWSAAQSVDEARATIAGWIGADLREVIFTSGATEANNLALRGAMEMYADRGRHVVTSAAEHRSVLDPVERLARTGWDVTVLPVDGHGRLDPARVRDAVRDDTVLVSVMLANNEVGTINPVAEIAAIARARGALVHTDAVQALGRLPVSVDDLGVDLLSMSAHKLYGPKGVGALFVRRRGRAVRLAPMLEGGGHERGLRSGTLNVPGIVGFGAAVEIARHAQAEEVDRMTRLRDRLESIVTGRLDGVVRNGHPTDRLPNNANLSFEGIEGESLVRALSDVAVSTGAACSSATVEPSHVLRAMGVEDALARASLRFGVGRHTTEEEIDYAADQVVEAVKELRARRARRATA